MIIGTLVADSNVPSERYANVMVVHVNSQLSYCILAASWP